jgi:maleylpyruvate isomerase
MIRLHSYWRSTAAYRVRIALNLKGLSYQQVTHDLRAGEQASAAYAAINPQKLIPTLEADGLVLTQSLAIIEWLDERHPEPALLPAGANKRALVRAMAQTVASDIHPLNNLRVLNRLRADFGADDAAVSGWIAGWIAGGFEALEAMIQRYGGEFAFGDAPTLADCCLVPQVYSATRFAVDLAPYPRLTTAAERAGSLDAFAAAHPSRQPDAN